MTGLPYPWNDRHSGPVALAKGNSSSSTATDASNKVSTHTAQSFGDIGLTGKQAEGVLRNLTDAAVANATESGKTFARLLGTVEKVTATTTAAQTNTTDNALARNAGLAATSISANSQVARDAIEASDRSEARTLDAIFDSQSQTFQVVRDVIGKVGDAVTGSQDIAARSVDVASETIRSGQAVDKNAGQLLAENLPFIAAAIAAALAIRGLARAA